MKWRRLSFSWSLCFALPLVSFLASESALAESIVIDFIDENGAPISLEPMGPPYPQPPIELPWQRDHGEVTHLPDSAGQPPPPERQPPPSSSSSPSSGSAGPPPSPREPSPQQDPGTGFDPSTSLDASDGFDRAASNDRLEAMRRDQDRRSAEARSNHRREQTQNDCNRQDLDDWRAQREAERAEDQRRQRRAEDLAAESTRRATVAAVQLLGALSAQQQAMHQAEQAQWQRAIATLRASSEAFERARTTIGDQTSQLVGSLPRLAQPDAAGSGRRQAVRAHATSIGRVHRALVPSSFAPAAVELSQEAAPPELAHSELGKPPQRSAMDNPGYQALADMQEYAQAATAFASASGSHRPERLDYAHISQGMIYEADACFAGGQDLTGDGLIAGARALADSVFTYENLSQTVGAASTLVGGMVDQLTGFKSTPLSAYSEFYRTGRFFGGSLKIYLDVAAAASLAQLATGLGGSTLALASGAALAPATAAVAAVAGVGATIMAIEAVVDGSKLTRLPKGVSSESKPSSTSTYGAPKGSQFNGMMHVPGTRSASKTAPKLIEDLKKTFRSDHYKALETTQEMKIYRAGTKGRPLGQFFTQSPGLSDLQVQVDSAVREVWAEGVKSPIDTVFEISIPKGQTIYVGEVRPQGDIHVGGKQQSVIPRDALLPEYRVTKKWPNNKWNIR